jgi:hypothetical protein
MKRLISAVFLIAILVLGSPQRTLAASMWTPGLGLTWQYQLQGATDTSVAAQVFDIDGFDTSASTVSLLHAQTKHVICYMDAGTWENWRPDAGLFPSTIKGRSNGWPGEKWLDIRQTSVLIPLMTARAQVCASKGFDAIEWDNVDGAFNRTGFPITAAQQATYNKVLAQIAHTVGLSAILKNDVDQVSLLAPSFDAAINEECYLYNECGVYSAFTGAGKAVFHVEYSVSTSKFCPADKALKLSGIRKTEDLTAWVQTC